MFAVAARSQIFDFVGIVFRYALQDNVKLYIVTS